MLFLVPIFERCFGGFSWEFCRQSQFLPAARLLKDEHSGDFVLKGLGPKLALQAASLITFDSRGFKWGGRA